MFDQEQAAIVAGTYSRNFALIRIPVGFSFWAGMPIKQLGADGVDIAVEGASDSEGEASADQEPEDIRRRKLGTFVHEYFHYLHNVSSLSGIYDLISQLRMARLFRETVDKTGKSYGSSVLPDEKQKEYVQLCNWNLHLRGGAKLSIETRRHIGNVKIKVLNVSRGTEYLSFQDPPIAAEDVTLTVEISSDSYPTGVGVMKFGTSCITEAIAWEADHVVEGADRDAPVSEAVSAVPYQVARAVLEYMLQAQVSAETVMRTSLLSLQSADPGIEFIEIANRLIGKSESEQELQFEIDKIAAGQMREMIAALDRVKAMLYTELTAFERIRPLGAAIIYLRDRCTEYIELRCSKPFLELDFLVGPLDFGKIVSLLESHPSCPVVQQDTRPTKGSFMVFGRPPPSQELIVSLGAFQGFMDFFSAHMLRSSAADTAVVRPRPCPFFSACGAPRALADSDVCRSKPWDSFLDSPGEEGLCWYAGGVIGSMGRPPIAPN